MKTMDAEIVRSRIVVCKKCGQQNRLYESIASGIYRCATCRTEMRNPFWLRSWLSRIRRRPRLKVLAVLVVVGMLIYIIQVKATLRNLQREQAIKTDKTLETHQNAAIKVGSELLKQSPKPAAVQETAELDPLQKAAQQGDASAQDSLGLRFYNHPNDPNDYGKAVELFEKAAAQGFAPGQYHLGVMYANGAGVPKDTAKAVESYKKAASQGNDDAISTLARFYNYNTSAPKDATQGDARLNAKLKDSPNESIFLESFQKRATQGDANAQYVLGAKYAAGEGVPKDQAKAAEWFQKAAAQGDADAQYQIGKMYYLGEGVPKDFAKAAEWCRKAAIQGNERAQSSLGDMYYQGKGVPRDDGKAIEWLQKAAAQGEPVAQANLGAMYAEGEGVRKDGAKAIEWLQKAADQGVGTARDDLRTLYAVGEGADRASAERSTPTYPTAPATSATPNVNVALLRHLATDNRLVSGSVLVDRLRQYLGKGKLTLDNGLAEDAYVKLVLNGKLMAAFYVRSHAKVTYSTIPDGSYTVAYCIGYGWDGTSKNFARGRHARRYDAPLNYSANQARDASGVTTYTDVMTLTLHKVAFGNVTTSEMSLEDFDRY